MTSTQGWHDLGDHIYPLYASALIKHYEMRDSGFKTRVVPRKREGEDWYVVQIFE